MNGSVFSKAILISSFSVMGVLLSNCAYFNTYYNAEKYFQDAVKEYSNLPPDGKITPTLRKKLDAVIDKSNNVLTLYPTSRWAENALYLLARASYYKGDYNFARKKFEEFLNLYPQSKLVPEVLIWYGRNLWKLNDRETAFYQWNRAIKKIRDNTLLAELYYSIAELHSNSNQLDSALFYYRKVTETGKSLEIAADAQYKIAEIYLKKNDAAAAIKNLKKVSQFSPSTRLRNQMQLLLTQIYRQSKRYNEAIEIINDRLNDQANEAIWGDLELQLGLVYLDKGDYDDAQACFSLITEKYKGKPVAAAAYYRLAQLNMSHYHNYEHAQTQFENVLKEDSKSPYANESRSRAAEIKRFFGLKKRLEGTLKQVTELERAKAMAQDTTFKKWETSSNPDEVKKAFEKQVSTKKGVDTAAVYADYYNCLFEVGESFYFNFGEIDSALYYYQTLAAYTYLNPVRDKALFCLFKIYQEKQDERAEPVKAELLQAFPYSRYTAALLNQTTILTETEQRAEDLFQIAERFRDTNLDSALIYYQRVVVNYPNTPAAEKSTMNIAYLYHHKLFNLEKAIEWYKIFTDNYPKHAYYAQFRATYEQLKGIKSALESQSQGESKLSENPQPSPPNFVPQPDRGDEEERP